MKRRPRERTGLMGAVRPQTPHRSPRQAFGGKLCSACLRQE
jgi:ribosomal protein L34E